MKAKLIAKEILALQKEYGNLEVYVYADHGQTPEESFQVDIGYINGDGEQIASEDVEETADYQKIIMIN